MGSTQWCCVLFRTNPRSDTLQNSSCMDIYLPSCKPSKTSRRCCALLEKKGQIHKWYSSMDSYTWIHQCWLTNKNLDTSIFINPSTRAEYDTRSIFKRSLAGFNSEFSFSWTSFLTKAEEPSLPYYLPIAGGRIIGFIPFSRVLVLCEM